MAQDQDYTQKALELKNEANQLFKEKRYHKAIDIYTKSLELKNDSVVFANRAQASINLKKWDRALMDCNRALQLGWNPKALYRRAVVVEAMGLYEQALSDLERLEKEGFSDVAAKKLKEKCANKRNDPMITVSAVSKGDELRTDDSLTKVDIEVIGNALSQLETTVDATSLEPSVSSATAPASLPELPVPRIFSDYENAFRQLQSMPAKFATYFLSIPTSKYPFLFNNLLETAHLNFLFQGLLDLLNSNPPGCSPDCVTECLRSLTNVTGLDLALMLMDDESKQTLNSILGRLSASDRVELQDYFDV